MSDLIKYNVYEKVIVFNYEVEHNKVLANIEEMRYILKKNSKEPNNTYMEKIFIKGGGSNDVTIDDPTKEFRFQIDQDDAQSFRAKDEFFQVFGIRYTGETKLRGYLLKEEKKPTKDSILQVVDNWAEPD